MRAARTACTESGTAKSVGSSPQPPAAVLALEHAAVDQRRERAPRRRTGCPPRRSTTSSRSRGRQRRREQLVEQPPASVGESGSSSSVARVARPPPQPGGARAAPAAPSRGGAAARATSRDAAARAGRAAGPRPSAGPRSSTTVGRSRGELLEELDPRVLQALARGERVERRRRRRARASGRGSRRSPSRSSTTLRRVALEDPEVLLQHLAERPVGDPAPVREAAAGAPQRLRRLLAEPAPELAHEPRLADAGVADDRHEVRLAARSTARRTLARRSSELARRGRRTRARRPPTPRGRISESARTSGRHATPLRLALRLDRRGSSNSKAPRTAATVRSPTRISPGVGGLLEPGGDVDRVAGDERAALARRGRRRPRRC